MLKKIKNTYKSEYMRTPLIVKFCVKFAFTIAFWLWASYEAHATVMEMLPISMIFAICFLSLFLLQYLKMSSEIDREEIIDKLEKEGKLPPIECSYGDMTAMGSDMIDYTNQEISTNLDEDEEFLLKMLSNLIVGVIYLVLFVSSYALGII